MIREGNMIYILDEKINRKNKEYTSDSLEIKKEINRLKYKIYSLEQKEKYSALKKEEQMKLKELKNDLLFWTNQMNSFDNLPSHKCLKRKTKKIKPEKLKILVLEIIQKYKENNVRYITIENIARILQVKESQLHKLFHELNLEGILSQPEHRFMHDSIRGGNCPIFPYEQSDWASDLYRIL